MEDEKPPQPKEPPSHGALGRTGDGAGREGQRQGPCKVWVVVSVHVDSPEVRNAPQRCVGSGELGVAHGDMRATSAMVL